MTSRGFVVLAATATLLAAPRAPIAAAPPQSSASGVDRMYVLDCGVGHAADQSRWTMGFNVGQPIDISVSCYLIHHKTGYFLWDTGVSDHVASMPDGWLPGGDEKNGIRWRRAKTLMAQLASLHVSPADIVSIGISHTHPDHIGNVELFPNTVLDIQKEEVDSYFAPGSEGVAAPPGDPTPRFSKGHKTRLVDEDLDVFGDGSVMLFYTPGHTPGHQSAIVHLPKTGYVILTGDAVHLRTNWDNRRIPYFGRQSAIQKLQFMTSMQRLADLQAFYHAQLWILHDKVQSDALKHAPQYYE
jgi:N-acyl homoserine lactone hydrolase